MIFASYDYFEVLGKNIRNIVLSLPDGRYASYENKDIQKHKGIDLPAEYLEDLCTMFDRNAYILKGYYIYEVRRSAHGYPILANIYTKPVKDVPFVKRGRYCVRDAKGINALLGFKLLNEVE